MKKYETLKIVVLNLEEKDIVCTSSETVLDNEVLWRWEF